MLRIKEGTKLEIRHQCYPQNLWKRIECSNVYDLLRELEEEPVVCMIKEGMLPTSVDLLSVETLLKTFKKC